MNIKKSFLLTGLICFFLFNSCRTPEKITTTDTQTIDFKTNNPAMMIPHPPIIIYKTKKDYSKNVPITLSADKTTIVSFPDIGDVYYNEDLAYPTKLARGFWLDNRGISVNSAFIKFTYEEFSQLSETPSPEILFDRIIENDPFKEMYEMTCDRDTSEINKLIRSGLKENCKKIK